jgi:hypothetical protein
LTVITGAIERSAEFDLVVTISEHVTECRPYLDGNDVRRRPMVKDRVVVLRSDDPLGFVADSCAALADSVNETREWHPSDQARIEAYAELLSCYANLTRPVLAADPGSATQLAVIEHLMKRLAEARAGEINMPVPDVADRLHAELTHQPLTV